MTSRADPSARLVPIVKVNGAKNDFVLIDERPPRPLDYGAVARAVCDRSGDVGADGLLVVLAPTGRGAAATMRIFNADGSEAEMCGNGIRCVARYLWERDRPGDSFAIDTLGGRMGVRVESGPGVRVSVDLGVPRIERGSDDALTVRDGANEWSFASVAIPNPHLVAFVADVDAVDLERLAALVASDPRFSAGTNVHVAQVTAGDTLRARHFERGVGPTAACGTGAVAIAVAAIAAGRVTSPVAVTVPGGVLSVRWNPGDRAHLAGETAVEYERTIAL